MFGKFDSILTSFLFFITSILSKWGSFFTNCFYHSTLLVPEVLIKLGSGVLLGSLGTFWLGEGLGFDWLFGDLAIAAIVAAYSGIAAIFLWWLKRDILTVEIADRLE